MKFDVKGRIWLLILFTLSVLVGVSAIYASEHEQEVAEHPIKALLIKHAGSVPDADDLKPFAGRIDAQKALKEILGEKKYLETWPGAVIAMGTITSLDNQDGVKIKDDLLRFMLGKLPFGCSNCAEPSHSSATLSQWDQKARLEVPVALGLLLQNIEHHNLSDGTPESVVLWKLGEIGLGNVPAPICATDEACEQVLELHAVRGLELSHEFGALEKLQNISEASSNPLVKREAHLVLEEIKEQHLQNKKPEVH